MHKTLFTNDGVLISELAKGRTFYFFLKICDLVYLHFLQTSNESIFL